MPDNSTQADSQANLRKNRKPGRNNLIACSLFALASVLSAAGGHGKTAAFIALVTLVLMLASVSNR